MSGPVRANGVHTAILLELIAGISCNLNIMKHNRLESVRWEAGLRSLANRRLWVLLAIFLMPPLLYLSIGYLDGISLVTHPRYGYLFNPWINDTYSWGLIPSHATPLMVASEENNYDEVKSLLERGADIHRTDVSGWTALHYAALKGNQRVAKLLLDAGCHINPRDNDGETPLATAMNGGHFSFAAWLHKQGGGGVPELHLAAATGTLQEVERLLNDDAVDITEVDVNGFTALHYAAWRGETAIVKRLVEAGIPPRVRNHEMTPLKLAAENGHFETSQYLKDVGY